MRLFIAIDLPEPAKETFSRIQEEIKKKLSSGDRITWVRPENMHLTLKFLGEVEEKNLNGIREKLKAISHNSFEFTMDEIGAFPEKDTIKVLWAGAKDEENLFELHKMVDFSLSKYFSVEREFKGHMTLGRAKNIEDAKRLRETIGSIKIEPQKFMIEKFVLVQSKLTPNGPEYNELEEYPLQKG